MDAGAAARLEVISPAHVAPSTTGFIVKRRFFGSFDITDTNGSPVFTIERELCSLNKTRTLFDRHGKPVALMKKACLTCTWKIYSADGKKKLATISPILLSLKDHANIVIHKFGEKPYLKIKGTAVLGMDLKKVVHGETIIATLQKTNIFFSRYSLTVSPHVDQAFAVALVAIFHAIKHPKHA